MLTAARCEKCNHSLPLKAPLGDFRLPPKHVPCPACGHQCATILPYRIGWMEALAHKLLVIASVPAAIGVALTSEYDALVAVGIALGGPLVVGVFGGFVVSKLLGLPLTLLRDTLSRAC